MLDLVSFALVAAAFTTVTALILIIGLAVNWRLFP